MEKNKKQFTFADAGDALTEEKKWIYISVNEDALTAEQYVEVLPKLAAIGHSILGEDAGDDSNVRWPASWINFGRGGPGLVCQIGHSMMSIPGCAVMVAVVSDLYSQKQNYEFDAARMAGVPVVQVDMRLVVPDYRDHCNGKVEPPSPPNN